jgi:hypothetical protein
MENSFMSRILALVILGALVGPVWADEEQPDAGKLARAVAPFIQARTVGIAHIDLNRLDLDALFKWAQEEKLIDCKELATKPMSVSAVQGLQRAGVQSVCVVLDLDFQPGELPPVVLFLSPKAKAGEVQTQLQLLLLLLKEVRVEKREGCLVVGSASALKRLGQAKRVERPELARVLGEHKSGAHRLVLFVPDDVRRAAEELVPELPAELGGGSIRPLTRGLRWLTLAVDLPPKPQLTLVAQTGNARSARAVADVAQRAAKIVAKDKHLQEELPEVHKLLESFQPQVEENVVRWSLGGEEAVNLLTQTIRRGHTAVEQERETANLKQLVLAQINYAEAHNSSMAPAVFADRAGKPLLSWRVHMLPYLGQQKLYQEFHLDEPWDSEHNKKLLTRMPKAFASSSHPELAREGKTTYLLPVGSGLFSGTNRPRFPASIPDGTSNTILIVEADAERAVPWTKPEDLAIDLDNPSKGLERHPGKGFLVGMADGSVRFVRGDVSKATLRAAFTPAGGEVLGSDW